MSMRTPFPPIDWSAKRLNGQTTVNAYRDMETLVWLPARFYLHDSIINSILASKPPRKDPTIWIVMGAPATGKSTLIASKLAPENPDAVVIDADNLWTKIPEYTELEAIDRTTVAGRTHEEVRFLRDSLLAEAVVKRLDVILEEPGTSEDFKALVISLKENGYKVALNCVDCPPEVARARMERASPGRPDSSGNYYSTRA